MRLLNLIQLTLTNPISLPQNSIYNDLESLLLRMKILNVVFSFFLKTLLMSLSLIFYIFKTPQFLC